MKSMTKDKEEAFGIQNDLIQVAGLFAWIVLWGKATSSLEVKQRDHMIYLSLLSIPPLLFFLKSKIPSLLRVKRPTLHSAVSIVSSLILLKLALRLGSWQSYLVSLLFASIQLALLPKVQFSTKNRIYGLIFLSSMWLFAARLAFWLELDSSKFPLSLGSLLISIPLLLILTQTLRMEIGLSNHPISKSRLVHGVLWSTLIVSLLALMKEIPGGESPAHHWSFYTGPAELIRAGGWLLYDVPSQYGLLNITLLALLPWGDSYLNLHLLLIIFYLIAASLFYLVWGNVFKSTLGRIIGVPSTLALVYFCPGWLQDLTGPMAYPSVGPFRFIFAELLVAVIFFSTKGKDNDSKQKPWIILGHAVWLIGVLWSAESAVYCTITWFPAYFLLSWNSKKILTLSRFTKIFAPPFLAFLTVLLGISVFYQISLGHWPDWSGFFEYALAYSKGFGAHPSSSKGTIWFVGLEFIALATFLVKAFIENESKSRKAIATASLCLFWSTLSYYATRTHDNNALNLLPIHFFCLLINVAALDQPFQIKNSLRWASFVPALLIPLFLVLNKPKVLNKVLQEKISYFFNLKGELRSVRNPELPKEAEELLRIASVKSTDPIAYLGHHLLILPSQDPRVSRLWLPLAPFVQFKILSPKRQAVYFKRWHDHLRFQGGFLLYSNVEFPNHQVNNLLTQNGYQPERTWKNGDWFLIRYQAH